MNGELSAAWVAWFAVMVLVPGIHSVHLMLSRIAGLKALRGAVFPPGGHQHPHPRGPLEGTANSLSRKINSMRNRMCAWKQRDNRMHCNSILTCESGFARYSVLLNMPVSPVHLRESPLEKGRPTTRLALTARGGVRLWGT